MINDFENFNEKRAVSGVGAGLYVKDETDGKYSLAILLETVPSVVGSYNTIEIDVTSSNTIAKINGKLSLDNKETPFLYHRDNVRRLLELTDEIRDFLIVTPDGMGQGFSGEIKFKLDDQKSSESVQGTLTITPISVDELPIMNVYPLLKKTVKFTTAVPAEIKMKKTGSYTKKIDLDPATAEIAVTSTVEQLTGQYSGKNLTLTSSSANVDSAVVELKATSEGCAPWTTTILVMFED